MRKFVPKGVHNIHKNHFDPIAIISGDKELIAAYGFAAIDLSRIKNHLKDLNQYGLLLVQRKDDCFRFLSFKEIVVGIYPSFKEVADEMGISCAFDFQLKDISKLSDYEWLSKWVTLKNSDRFSAESKARAILLMLKKTRIENAPGSNAIGIIEDLMWATNVFEPLHALTILTKGEPMQADILSLEYNLRNIGAGLRQLPGSINRILTRRKSSITLMDCAKFLFLKDYFEIKLPKLSKTLGISGDKLSSHFRGYLIVDDAYVSKLVGARGD